MRSFVTQTDKSAAKLSSRALRNRVEKLLTAFVARCQLSLWKYRAFGNRRLFRTGWFDATESGDSTVRTCAKAVRESWDTFRSDSAAYPCADATSFERSLSDDFPTLLRVSAPICYRYDACVLCVLHVDIVRLAAVCRVSMMSPSSAWT